MSELNEQFSFPINQHNISSIPSSKILQHIVSELTHSHLRSKHTKVTKRTKQTKIYEIFNNYVLTKGIVKQNAIKALNFHLNSPDMNTIENLLWTVKTKIYKNRLFRPKEEHWKQFKLELKKLDKETCTNLIKLMS
ncbi:hypothetical protein RFI_04656 [Reticulomyxa filosa]|uniref:Uncharacterized protein n=1 Tax=Reticulomyxa filosa TaxID=46433 RepID=X6P4D8_RETFI|nr:hypothetical protein RFI_04656 [Reticulomyxa filosa]|eukprot:ETO32462.1 hypothetical protein RFI_04656 [Reticulomyxa filosa]